MEYLRQGEEKSQERCGLKEAVQIMEIAVGVSGRGIKGKKKNKDVNVSRFVSIFLGSGLETVGCISKFHGME